MSEDNDLATKRELAALEDKVDGIGKLVMSHETRFAVRAESDKRIDDKFKHLESKIDNHHVNQTKQLTDQATNQTAMKNALLKVAWAFATSCVLIIVSGVAFVLSGVVSVG